MTRCSLYVVSLLLCHTLSLVTSGITSSKLAASGSASATESSYRLKRWVGIHYRSRCRCVEGTNNCTCTPRIVQGMWSGPGYYNGTQLQWADSGGYRCVIGNCTGTYYPGAYPNSRAEDPSSPFNPASYDGNATYPSFLGSRGPYFSPRSHTYFFTLPHNISPALPPPERTPIDLR